MPDRRRRTAFRHPLTEPSSLLMRERQSPTPGSSSSSSSSSPSGSSGSGPQDDNPFAPPPEDRPDQPWQPRHPANGGNNGNGNGDGGDAPEDGSTDNRPVWGSQWSSHQPGHQSGGFGGQPAGPTGPNGPGGGKGGPEGKPGGLRWDPTDPVQRRARYSLLAGMWAFFFAIFDLPEIALLLGALATYWSISALRAKPKDPSAAGDKAAAQPAAPGADAALQGPGAAAGPAPAPGSAAVPGAPGSNVLQRGSRQLTTAAVSGLVTALIALAIVVTSFTVQLVYRDYYTCVNDALTKSGQVACNDLLPKPLEPLFGVKK
ncbi:hypothetical protein [Streptomyces sp. ITFR-6]|uniref:hypothetical protein n=1 Tax=Streptomyces sp. ITFR-6 TaxID=3075197 RepID=UPI00288B60FE|nr:hypothetical protein [Streptomyces sp. ITFR-6]WNI29737.1 hypothetical protein RLT59_13755 [Streptomyces sp. ITFR-6]